MSDGPSDARSEMDEGGWHILGPRKRQPIKPKVSPLKAQLAEAQAYIQHVSDELDRANANHTTQSVISALGDLVAERDALR